MHLDKNEQVIVTGGAGFIGANLIKRLLQEGHKVISIDNYTTGSFLNHQEGALYVDADIRSMPRWAAVTGYIQPSIIFHLAALPRIQPSFDNPYHTFSHNTEGSLLIAELARKHNAKVIYAGSSSRWHNPYRSPYACFKHMGEEVFKLYRQVYDLDAEIVRFYNVYGPYEITEGDWAAVIGKWRYQIQQNHYITIVGDGEQRRDFTHVDDIVDGLYRIAMSDEKHEDAWELGTGVHYSINEVYQMFYQRFGRECVYVPDQKGNYRKTLRENNDALQRLGWQPQDRLAKYISELI